MLRHTTWAAASSSNQSANPPLTRLSVRLLVVTRSHRGEPSAGRVPGASSIGGAPRRWPVRANRRQRRMRQLAHRGWLRGRGSAPRREIPRRWRRTARPRRVGGRRRSRRRSRRPPPWPPRPHIAGDVRANREERRCRHPSTPTRRGPTAPRPGASGAGRRRGRAAAPALPTDTSMTSPSSSRESRAIEAVSSTQESATTMMCVASGSRPADCRSAVMQAATRAASFRAGTTTPTRQVMTVPRHRAGKPALVGAEQSETVRLAQMLVHLVAAQHVRVAVAPPVHGDQRASRFQAATPRSRTTQSSGTSK